MNSPTPPAGAIPEEQVTRRLSCDRCHTTKIRCQRFDGESCVRCHRRGVECVYSARLPRGRPRAKSHRRLSAPLAEGGVSASVTGTSKKSDSGHAHAISVATGSSRAKTAEPGSANSISGQDGPSAPPDLGDMVTTVTEGEARTTLVPSSAIHDMYTHDELFEGDLDTMMTDSIFMSSPQSNTWYSNSKTLTSTPSPASPPTASGSSVSTSTTNTTRPLHVENGFWAFVHGKVRARCFHIV